MNITVIRTETVTRNFESKSEADKWIERQQQNDQERNKDENTEIWYEIWHSPHPASE